MLQRTHLRSRLLALITFAGVACGALAQGGLAQQDALPRRSSLGVNTLSQSDGIVILSVKDQSAADKAGVKANDRLLSLNGKPLADTAALLESLRTLPGGSAATLVVRRDDKEVTLQATLDTTPVETLEGHDVVYGSVRVPPSGATTQPYLVRTITTTPKQAITEKRPVFVYLQGIYCASIDRPGQTSAPDTRLVHALANEGFITLRVDKAGLGDSQGPACGELDFTSELTAYIEAIRQVKTLEGVDPDRVYIFGHSMGGIFAPLIAQATPIRGIIAYGTTSRTWLEYTLENTRRQLLLSGLNEEQVTDSVLMTSRIFAPVLIDKQTPGDVWKEHPELKEEDNPMIDEKRIASRDAKFFHQLQDINLAAAWANANTNVLALHGEFDWVSSKEDHDTIAKIVAARDGAIAESRTLSFADHGLTSHLTLQQSLSKVGQGQELKQLPKLLADWIRRVEGTKEAPSKNPTNEAPTELMSLAQSWAQFMVGSWDGAVTTTRAGTIEGESLFTMKLDVERTDDPNRFDFRLTYDGAAGTQVRPYTLIIEGENVSIDENNGIVLPAALIGNALHTTFEIDGAHIAATYNLIEPGNEFSHIEFTLTSSQPASTRDASSSQTSGSTAPALKTWLPTSTQTAILTAKKEQ
jgi:pimeloyl-ACP methyl ester carboxylesterase